MIAFSVCALRHVGPLYAEMRDGKRPRHQMGRHLGGRVVGLHGCGFVGKEVVRLLQTVELHYPCLRPSGLPRLFIAEYGV